jgi:hypothetical protein
MRDQSSAEFSQSQFLIDISIFRNINVVCLHVAKERQGVANLATIDGVDHVYRASTLAGQSLDKSKEVFVSMFDRPAPSCDNWMASASKRRAEKPGSGECTSASRL